MSEQRLPCKRCKGVGIELNQAHTTTRLKRLRTGLTATEVSAEMKVSISYLSDLEAGRKRWNFNLVEAFEQAVIKIRERRSLPSPV